MNSLVAERPPLLSGLSPICDEESRVLILGSFPSEASLRAQEYYAHPRNNFWPIVEGLFGIDRRGTFEERAMGLIENRIAVWDVISQCRREGSADQAIQDARPNELVPWLDKHPRLRGIAFNGTKAEETARKTVPDLFLACAIQVRRFPSTSAANASMNLASKTRAWSQIKEWAGDDA